MKQVCLHQHSAILANMLITAILVLGILHATTMYNVI